MNNTQNLQQIAPESVKYAVFAFNLENLTPDRIFFTQAKPVVPETNMRYVLVFT